MVVPVMEETTTHKHTRPVPLGKGVTAGGTDVVLMAGPCAVESYEQTRAAAAVLAEHGVRVLRGGAYKPRTSPNTFQGLGEEGLRILRAVADEFDMLVITESLGVEHIPLVAEYADIIQIGSRNMQHYPLLWAAGETEMPVLLKRGFMSTVREWLLAAEHIESRGNDRIMLAERGVRSFDDATRNVLDTSAIALARLESPYPVIGDPSHATGRRDLVIAAARSAVAAGADGLLVEVHPNPPEALSDGPQSLWLGQVPDLMEQTRRIAAAMGRSLV
ncbi:MAG: 3-deoxy-7-phosphoheptulonate synthase [Chloroflexi bacterium]|nr:3-deoxy-7-phosphoheptulonate synthase [Chloroflexota bacterium]